MIQQLIDWFQDYTESFYTGNAAYDRNVQLKQEHCRRVADLAKDIAQHEGLPADLQERAFLMGLLHDIGRFEQYKQFHTFADYESVNHGKLGADILADNPCFSGLPPVRRQQLLDVVRFHNCAALPMSDDQEVLMFLRIIRDADKIDIFDVSFRYFSQRTSQNKNATLELNVCEDSNISDKIFDRIMAGSLAMMVDIKTLNDFKALQLSWIFDVNYQRSFELIRERDAIRKIYSTFPENHARANSIYQKINTYLADRAAQPSPNIVC